MKNIEKPMNELPVMHERDGIVLFYPNIPDGVGQKIEDVIGSRWIGQGPRVQQFEQEFQTRFAGSGQALAVGSGTDALHLAYLLAGFKSGDEVIVPVFTCTATNIPLLYMGVHIRFADVDPKTLNINTEHVKELINEKTKGIVCVHYGGLPCEMNELRSIADQYGIPIIEDAAHALGATYMNQPIGAISPFTIFSFQAIKHITTGDGGMLIVQDKELATKGERLRWFGIDRTNKQKGTWENDITEIGYKYQMTDIAAAMGISALQEFTNTLSHRQSLFEAYIQRLKNNSDVTVVGETYQDRTHAAWLLTVLVDRRIDLMHRLRDKKIESGQVHYRNDRYSIFGGRRNDLPHMDSIEERYLVLPLHTKVTLDDVHYICDVIQEGW